MNRSIMLQGTASNVGKSLLSTALCRIYTQEGYRTVPFKSQNMALNSYITQEGLEIGRAQAVQAEACRVEPNVRMNPILLKPSTDRRSQIIVMGKVYDQMDAAAYHQTKSHLRQVVQNAYQSLAQENDLVVIEGAGSPAEINLREHDFVNMGMAEIADCPVLLIGDIDRGGVFASLYGTIMLLSEEERARIKGVLINKFRGDIEILKPGLQMLEKLIGRPVLGVIPYIDIKIEEEDSLSTLFLHRQKKGQVLSVQIIRHPRISNFTDFQIFERYPDVQVRFVEPGDDLEEPDLIILPGSKSTMADLRVMRESGMERQIIRQHKKGVPIIGICAGYQMLGQVLRDPQKIESEVLEMTGMGLLDHETIFEEEKQTYQVQARIKKQSIQRGSLLDGIQEQTLKGYHIHCGQSVSRFGWLLCERLGESENWLDGNIHSGGEVMGCYLHGLFDNPDFTEHILKNLRERKGMQQGQALQENYEEFKHKEYDKMANHFRENADLEAIHRIIFS